MLRKYWRSITGVGRWPNCATCSRQAACSSSRSHQAMWCTVPAPWQPDRRRRLVVGVDRAPRGPAGRTRRAPCSRSPSPSVRSRSSTWSTVPYARTPSKPSSACSGGMSAASARSGSSSDRRPRARARGPRGRSNTIAPADRVVLDVDRPRRRAARTRRPAPSSRGDPPAQPVDHARPGAAGRRVGELEEGQDRAGRAPLVAVIQVVDVRGVEVDRLLDQPQPEHARVEVDIARARRP